MKNKISVCVIAFNSEQTILETLNSILNQSIDLSDVEVIITDDCSTDLTNELVKQWVLDNSVFFNNVVHIESDINEGISKNINKALKMVSFQWVKLIAGDDILIETCLINNLNYVKCNANVNVVFSIMEKFSENGKVNGTLPSTSERYFFKMSLYDKLDFLKLRSISGAPTAFFKSEILKNIGYMDESYILMEDYPLWFKLIKNGYDFHFMDKHTIRYRINDSISRSSSRIINEQYLNDIENFDKDIIYPEIGYFLKIRKQIWYFLFRKYVCLFKNQYTRTAKLMYRPFILIFKPGMIKEYWESIK